MCTEGCGRKFNRKALTTYLDSSISSSFIIGFSSWGLRGCFGYYFYSIFCYFSKPSVFAVYSLGTSLGFYFNIIILLPGLICFSCTVFLSWRFGESCKTNFISSLQSCKDNLFQVLGSVSKVALDLNSCLSVWCS